MTPTKPTTYAQKKRVHTWLFGGMTLLLVILIIANLMVGDISYNPREVMDAILGRGDTTTRHIITTIRGTRLVVALLIGIVLPLCGLMMQTIFQNPLADPYILGVSSGTSLGVALFLLGAPLLGDLAGTWLQDLGMLGAGWLGALLVLGLVLGLSQRIKNIFGVLIIGVMISYITSAIIQILQYFSSAEQLKLFTLWNLGSLSNVTQSNLLIILPILFIGVIMCVLAIKPLNLLLLGDTYATSMGLNIRQTRALIFGATTLMAGTITAFCGPIGFIGLAVPHVTRTLFKTANHRVLLPATALVGACTMMLADILAKVLTIPINAVTALLGIPVILIVILRTLR